MPDPWYSDPVVAVATAVGALLGALLRWVFEQLSAEFKARREFAKSAAERVTNLAERHYWRLATATGGLASVLEQYLELVEAHLMVPDWQPGTGDLARPSQGQFPAVLDRLTNTDGEGDEGDSLVYLAFNNLCRVLWYLDDFQYRGSETYLLTTHHASEQAKRLVNRFTESLAADADPKLEIQQLIRLLDHRLPTGRRGGEQESSEKMPPASAGQGDAGLAPGADQAQAAKAGAGAGKDGGAREIPDWNRLDPECIQRVFKDPLAAWAYRMRWRLEDIAEAATCMRAYSELLSHELALLFRQFHRGPSDPHHDLRVQVAHGDWPNVLSTSSAIALESLSGHSTLLKPVGGFGLPPAGTGGGEREVRAEPPAGATRSGPRRGPLEPGGPGFRADKKARSAETGAESAWGDKKAKSAETGAESALG
jgi:hypothetical protein